MKRNKDEIFEQILKRVANQPGDQDDVTIYIVKHKGKEYPIYERRRELELVPDPEDNTRFIPKTVSRVISQLGDDRMPLGKPNNAGLCRFGCYANVKALLVCKHCRRVVCKEHSFSVGKRPYCRKGLCSLAGRTYQAFWNIYRVLRFCFCSVFGISIDKDQEEYTGDEEILESSQEDEIEI